MTAVAPAPVDLGRVYGALLAAYGPQGWWPVEGPERDAALEICAGAILVQHTTWEGAARALRRLREAGTLSIEAFVTLPEDELGELLRGAGTYRTKARRLRSFAGVVRTAGSIDAFLAGDSQAVRERCLEVWGVGPETADAIVLYAARLPTFLASAYARRLFARLGVLDGDLRYEPWREELLARLPAGHVDDAARLGEWHALVVAHGKARCRARAPRCEGCPLRADCAAAA